MNNKIETLTDADYDLIDNLSAKIHRNAIEHGFHEDYKNATNEVRIQMIQAQIARMHSELSEALESIRAKDIVLGNDGEITISAADKHVPYHMNVTVELADCIIRILDTCILLKLPIWDALIDKHNYNCDRPYKHGKNS